MFKLISQFFTPKSVKQLIENEIDEAQRALLKAHDQCEYSALLVEYYENKISRLKYQADLTPVAYNSPPPPKKELQNVD
jgi:hypothetical protein